MHHCTITPESVEWLAAACYSQHTLHLPDPVHFYELPPRMQNKWREIARQWIETLIPLLNPGIQAG